MKDIYAQNNDFPIGPVPPLENYSVPQEFINMMQKYPRLYDLYSKNPQAGIELFRLAENHPEVLKLIEEGLKDKSINWQELFGTRKSKLARLYEKLKWPAISVGGNILDEMEATERYMGQERAVDVLTSAYGMRDEIYKDIVHRLTGGKEDLIIGLTPEVIKIIHDIVTQLPADWSNPIHKDAILGIIEKGAEKGGPRGAIRNIQNLLNFYKNCAENPGFDINEMFEVIYEFINIASGSSHDPKELATKINVFLDKATKNPDDPYASLGIGPTGRRAYFMKGLFRNILTEASELPDVSQLIGGAMSREMLRMWQNMYAIERYIMQYIIPHAMKGMSEIPYVINRIAEVIKNLSPIARVTVLTNLLRIPGVGRLFSNSSEFWSLYQQAHSLARQPMMATSKSNNKNVRIAQFSEGPIQEQNNIPAEQVRRQNIVLQSIMEEEGAISGRMAIEGGYLSSQEAYNKALLEAEINRLESTINYFLRGLEQQQLTAPDYGLATPEILPHLESAVSELTDKIKNLINIYDLMLSRAYEKYKRITSTIGPVTRQQYNKIMAEVLSTISIIRNKQREWIFRLRSWEIRYNTIRPILEQRYIEVTKTEPLRALMELSQRGTGTIAPIGPAVVASIYDQIQALEEAKKNLASRLPPDRARAEIAKINTQIYKLMAEASDIINRSTGSVIPATSVPSIIGF